MDGGRPNREYTLAYSSGRPRTPPSAEASALAADRQTAKGSIHGENESRKRQKKNEKRKNQAANDAKRNVGCSAEAAST